MSGVKLFLSRFVLSGAGQLCGQSLSTKVGGSPSYLLTEVDHDKQHMQRNHIYWDKILLLTGTNYFLLFRFTGFHV